MAGSINRATILGHVGKDPDIRTTQSGMRVASFSVATSEKWKDKNTGEDREATEWHRVVTMVDGLVGVIDKYVNKGTKVLIEGQIKTRKWTDDKGVERYSTEIMINGTEGRLVLLSSPPGDRRDDDRDSGSERRNAKSGGGTTKAAGKGGGSKYNDDLDDDIPF